MCGIAGSVGAPLPERARAALLDAIARRGPDDQGTWSEGDVWFGHRRLSIIGVDAAGRNPMFNEDESLVLVFNGEIFNYRELREELVSKGHRFRSHADTEVLLHLYEEHGASLCDRLDGMYAFALWDRRRRTLLVARDPFGEKPLYFVHDASRGAVHFGSSLVGLVRAGLTARALDPAAVEAYLLFGAVMGDEMPLRDVRALRPGHRMTFALDERCLVIAPHRTIHADVAPVLDDVGPLGWSDVVGAVRRRMIADVPVGVFLSGGVDSTAVAAAMREVVPGRLMSFSIGYERANAVFDETTDAERSAELIGTEHHTQIISGDDFAGALDDIASATELPSHDGINTYFASRLAGAHVKVAMTGIGGDELFGGYSTFRYEREARRRGSRSLRALHWVTAPVARRIAERAEARGRTAWPLLLLDQAAPGREDPLYRWYQVRRLTGPAGVRDLMRDGDRLLSTDPWPAARRRLLSLLDAPAAHALDVRVLETAGYMSPVLLRDADAMSMHHALELRVPFLDRAIVRRALAYESDELLAESGGKAPLRRAIRGHVPDHCLSNPKRGFGVPLGTWMRHPRVREEIMRRLHEPPAAIREILDATELRRVAAAFYGDSGAGDKARYRLFARVWLLYSLVRWADEVTAA